jgi:hypothetical protein
MSACLSLPSLSVPDSLSCTEASEFHPLKRSSSAHQSLKFDTHSHSLAILHASKFYSALATEWQGVVSLSPPTAPITLYIKKAISTASALHPVLTNAAIAPVHVELALRRCEAVKVSCARSLGAADYGR